MVGAGDPATTARAGGVRHVRDRRRQGRLDRPATTARARGARRPAGPARTRGAHAGSRGRAPFALAAAVPRPAAVWQGPHPVGCRHRTARSAALQTAVKYYKKGGIGGRGECRRHYPPVPPTWRRRLCCSWLADSRALGQGTGRLRWPRCGRVCIAVIGLRQCPHCLLLPSATLAYCEQSDLC